MMPARRMYRVIGRWRRNRRVLQIEEKCMLRDERYEDGDAGRYVAIGERFANGWLARERDIEWRFRRI